MPQKEYKKLLIITRKMQRRKVSQLRTGANLVVSQIQEIGNHYNEQKREIYRREKIFLGVYFRIDSCPTEKNLQSEVAETDLPSSTGN